MNIDPSYVADLEKLVLTKLLPTYKAYYKLIGKEPPPLDSSALPKTIRQVPALLRSGF